MVTLDVPTEKQTQHGVKTLLDKLGVSYFDTSQPHRAMITPGVPDLICFSRRRGHFYVEVKRPGGKLSPAQEKFRDLCRETGTAYIVGGVTEVASFLGGLVR